MTAHLQIKHGPQTGRRIPLSTTTPAKFGAKNGSDTPCFEIENGAEGYMIRLRVEGLPVFVNGREVTQPQSLKDGDEIALPPEMIFVYRQTNQTMAGSRTKVKNGADGVPGWLIWIGLILLINLLSAIFNWPFWVW